MAADTTILSEQSSAVDADSCAEFFADPAKIARLRALVIDARQTRALADTFHVLGDPTRVRILDALAHEELCVCDLATLLGLTESAVSHQLRMLRGMRLVRSRRDGRMMFYALDDQHIITLFHQGLHHVAEASPAGPPAGGPSRQQPAPDGHPRGGGGIR